MHATARLAAALALVPAGLSQSQPSMGVLLRTILTICGLSHFPVTAEGILAVCAMLENENKQANPKKGMSYIEDMALAAALIARVRDSVERLAKANGARYALTDALASNEAKRAIGWIEDGIRMLK